jgi:tRNA (guanine37-N1)-methyltransferase
MRIEILTLFPGIIDAYISESIIGRGIKNKAIEINCTNIRDFSTNKHRKVDDAPFGGGYGMVMTCQPIVDCCRSVVSQLQGKTRRIYLSPQGSVFTQEKAKELLEYDNLVLICGHYEGVDERAITLCADEEISVGDYVLTGGELPAMILADCVSRLVPGVLPATECFSDESLENGLLEYPQYTRPRVFEGLEVPEVLLSGHEANIKKWRYEQSVERTMKKRPDILKKNGLNK